MCNYNMAEIIFCCAIWMKKAHETSLKLEESIVETYTNKVIADLIACEDEVSHKKIVADEKMHIRNIKKMMK